MHRIIAETFISNPENKSDVNHIDADKLKLNNHVSNLEWLTRKENMQHAQSLGLLRGNKRSTLSEDEKKDKRALNVKKFIEKNPERFKQIQREYYLRKKAKKGKLKSGN